MRRLLHSLRIALRIIMRVQTHPSRKKVLFVSHDAGRTGAPIILLDFLRWFKNNTEIPFQVLLKRGGELETEFQALAPVTIYTRKSAENGHDEVLFYRKWSDILHRTSLKQELGRGDIGLVYSNTLTNGEILHFLSGLGCPVITHVHELEYWIHRFGPKNFDWVKRYTDHYIAVSEAVRQNLVFNHRIPEDKIDIVKGFIPRPVTNREPGAKSRIRESLGISDDAFIVGGSGAENWRKGTDLFIQTALTVVRSFDGREIHFLWVGGGTEETETYELQHDIRHAGLTDRVHFVGHVSNPTDYYDEFDIFAMTSREDPFPLVNLEVAALGKPIVCFKGAGGTPEFVEDNAGFVVPYLDIHAMADRIVFFATHEELRKEFGLAAAKKVTENHDISIGAAKLLNVINRFLPPA